MLACNKQELPTGIWSLVGFKKWHKDARDGKQAEAYYTETDFFGDLHCNSRFTDMLCDAQAQYQDYSDLDKCPMWGMWEKEGGE